jgi:hypothetical protein
MLGAGIDVGAEVHQKMVRDERSAICSASGTIDATPAGPFEFAIAALRA